MEKHVLIGTDFTEYVFSPRGNSVDIVVSRVNGATENLCLFIGKAREMYRTLRAEGAATEEEVDSMYEDGPYDEEQAAMEAAERQAEAGYAAFHGNDMDYWG